jgi:hypothetical protein
MPRRISTVRGREFGDGVRATLAAAGLTARAACRLLDWDEAKLSDLVNGKGGSTELELGFLLGICRTPPPERDHLIAVFREVNVRGWWQQHGTSSPIRPRTFIQHLNTATEFIGWSPLLVPGLLQVPDYIRAVALASATAPSAEAEERVAARLAMQEVFRRQLRCTFFIHEFALRLPVGGPEAMSDQLHHLLRLSVRPYVTMRMVPIELGAHAGLAGSFSMMKFDKAESVVFLESENSSLFIEESAAVGGYKKVLASLDRTALDAEQSRRRISGLAT